MKIIDFNNEAQAVELAPAAARTATANGTGVDIRDFQGILKVLLNIGAVTGTAPTLDVKIQDSADNSTFADVTGYAFAQQTAAANLALGIDTRNLRRYIRAVMTIGGTTPSFPCAILAIGQKQVI